MVGLHKIRVLLAITAVAVWAANWLLAGNELQAPPRVSNVFDMGLHPASVLEVLPSILLLAAGLLSFASPVGIIFSIVFSVIGLSVTSSYDPRLLGESAITGALVGALASDAAKVLKSASRAGAVRKASKGRDEKKGGAIVGESAASFFPIGPLRIPRVIRGFRVVEYIGRGGQVAVYKVRDNGSVFVMKIPLGAEKAVTVWREVEIMKALKSASITMESVRKALAECGDEENLGPDVVANLIREHQANVIGLVTVNEDVWRKVTGGETQDPLDPPFIIVEYADKGDAAALAGTRRVNAKLLEDIAGAAALFYLATGLVHRDLKLENILLASTPGGGVKPKLADFATAAPPGRSRGWNPGTPTYMPPEGLFYRDIELTPAYDVYSLAVLFYKLLTGEYPLRQHYFIAVSRHPRISDDIRQEALRVVRMFEFTHLGTAGVIIKKIRDIVYPPRPDRADGWEAEALRRLSDYLRSDPAGASIVSREKEVLQEGLSSVGLPNALSKVILDALDPDPHRRPANTVCFYVKLRRAMAEA